MRKVYLLLMLLSACGGDDSTDEGPDGGPGTSFGCGDPPACHLDAVAHLRACVTESALAISGDAGALVCSAGDVSVAFSAFTENPGGTVPEPSGALITSAGTACSDLSWGDGFSESGGERRDFIFTEIDTLAGNVVAAKEFDDGGLDIECGRDIFSAAPGALSGCPSAIQIPDFERADDVSSVQIDLRAQDGSRTPLLACD